MAVPTQITDHAAQALARLPEQFSSATNIQAILNAFSAQTQATEDAGAALLDLYNIDTQTGDALNKIGEAVNEPRDGASDADYRTAIRGKIAVIFESGTPDELISTFVRITASVATYLWEGTAHVGIWGDVASYPATTAAEMGDAVAGGVLFSEMWEWETIAGDAVETVAGDQIYLLAVSQ